MELTHLVAFNIALLAAIASPGPAMLVAIKTSLTSGRRAGIALGLGLGTMASLWTLAALLGLEAIFLAFPWAYATVKFIGALYLLYIAYGMWMGARDPMHSNLQPARHAYRQGVIVNFLNPKSVLFAAAVLVIIFPAGMTMTENLIVVGNHFLVEAICYTGLSMSMSHSSVNERYIRAKSYIDRASSLILGALGLRLLLSR